MFSGLMIGAVMEADQGKTLLWHWNGSLTAE